MFESLRGADDVIKFVAAYDDNGESKSKIDTKKEYEVLGKYLNGASAWNTDENGEEYRMNYADLSSKDKKILFDLMDSLKSQFGDWKNVFTPETDVDNETIHLYLERFKEFQIRLNQFDDDSKREEYFNDIKKELEQVENKIKSFCSKNDISVPLDIEVINDLHKIFDNLKYEVQVKEFLANNNDNFIITNDNAEEYVYMADYLLHNSSPTTKLLKEDFNKAANIMRKAYAEYMSQFSDEITPENIHKIDIIDGVEQISAALKNKKQINPQLKQAAKDFLTMFEKEYEKLDTSNAEEFAGMFQFMVDNYDELEFSDEEKIKFNKLKQSFAKYLNSWQKDINEDNISDFKITICTVMATDYYNRLYTMQESEKQIKNVTLKPYDKTKLISTVNQYIKDNNIKPLDNIPAGVDVGNGRFDKTSTQKTENCWIHAGINSLISTDEGKKLVENNYYRDEKTGVIAVHIPEAEQFGLHGGIYYVTPQEIIDSRGTVADGEGDITAYIIAIQKYFDEVNANTELKEQIGEDKIFSKKDEGNAGFRFYELMTAADCITVRPEDNDDIKNLNGISRGTCISFDTDSLYSMVENKNGAIIIALKGENHAISIIGVKDNKFLVQESNNDSEYLSELQSENGEVIFEKSDSINDKPTFTISKEALQKFDLGMIECIKWQ